MDVTDETFESEVIGRSAETPKVRVQWPSGHVEEWSDVAIDRWITLKEGSGR